MRGSVLHHARSQHGLLWSHTIARLTDVASRFGSQLKPESPLFHAIDENGLVSEFPSFQERILCARTCISHGCTLLG
jgi:hypothetical protein